MATLDTVPTITAGFTLGNSTELALNGETLTLPQALLQGTLAGPGTVTVDNATISNTFLLTGGVVLSDAGTASVDGNAELDTGTAYSATLQVAAAGTLDAPTDAIVTANGTAVIDNAWLIEKTGFTGTTTIAGSLDNTDLIAVDAGKMLALSGGGTLGGTIGGAGELDLGGGTFALSGSLSLATATLGILGNGTQVNLSADTEYAGAFNLAGGATLNLERPQYFSACSIRGRSAASSVGRAPSSRPPRRWAAWRWSAARRCRTPAPCCRPASSTWAPGPPTPPASR